MIVNIDTLRQKIRIVEKKNSAKFHVEIFSKGLFLTKWRKVKCFGEEGMFALEFFPRDRAEEFVTRVITQTLSGQIPLEILYVGGVCIENALLQNVEVTDAVL